jgi:hypothetical protein
MGGVAATTGKLYTQIKKTTKNHQAWTRLFLIP